MLHNYEKELHDSHIQQPDNGLLKMWLLNIEF